MDRRVLDNARHPRESFAAYRKRRKEGNAFVKRYLRGTLAHRSAACVVLPALGVDKAADGAVIRGLYRRVMPATLPDGRQVRFAVTKGTTFAYPDRQAHRAAVLAQRRQK